jgi:hypothetical protein
MFNDLGEKIDRVEPLRANEYEILCWVGLAFAEPP